MLWTINKDGSSPSVRSGLKSGLEVNFSVHLQSLAGKIYSPPLANVCELESSMCPKHWEDFASGLASLLVFFSLAVYQNHLHFANVNFKP